DRPEPQPTARFAWWRRSGPESAPAAPTAPELAQPSGTGATATATATMAPGDARPSLDIWPERRGLSRYFPLLSRRWSGRGNGIGSGREPDNAKSSDGWDARRGSWSDGSRSTASAWLAPQDRHVRPLDTAGNGTASVSQRLASRDGDVRPVDASNSNSAD